MFPRKITARIDRGASFWGRTVEVSQFCPAETEPGSEGPIQETWALSKARLHNRGRQHLVHREGRITVRLEHCEERLETDRGPSRETLLPQKHSCRRHGSGGVAAMKVPTAAPTAPWAS